MQRLAGAVATLWLTTAAAFFALEVTPGDYLSEARMDGRVPEATLRTLEAQYGLQNSALERYGRWLSGAVQGDLGKSFATGEAVGPVLWERGGKTLVLVAEAQVLVWVAALGLGLWGVRKSRGWVERVLEPVAYGLLSVPDVVLVLGVALLFAKAGQEFSSGWGPVLALGLGLGPAAWLQVRSALRQASGRSFVEGARARGFAERVVLLRYVMPAACPSLAALAGLSVGTSLSASLLVECTMGYPGLGPLLLEAILSRDVNVALGAVVLAAVVWTVGNAVGELLQVAVDPRLRRVA